MIKSPAIALAPPKIFRLLMKGKFDVYVMGPLANRVQN